MSRRSGLWALGLAGVVLATAWGTPEQTRRFPYVKALVPATGGESVGVFEIDEEMLAALDAGMCNWRIFDDQGNEVPYLLRPRRATRGILREVPVTMETVSLEILRGNRIQVEYRAPAGTPAPALWAIEIESACRDFEKHVTVRGSEDGDSWETLAEARPIFDYSRFMDVRNSRVELRSTRVFPRIRIEIANITESRESPWVNLMKEKQGEAVARESESYSLKREDFRVERVRFLQQQLVPAETREMLRGYTVRGLRLEEDAALKETRLFFETARVPVRSVHLLTASVNFNRRAVLEAAVSGDGTVAWAPVAAGGVSRVAVGGYRQESLALETGPGTRWPRYRLTIANGDNPPLVVDGIAVTGTVYEAVFFRDPARLYEAYYGGPTGSPPEYDIASVLGGREPAGLCRFTPEGQAANPRFDPKATQPAPSGKRVMVVVVILAVVTLIWLVAQSARGVGKLDRGAGGDL